MAGISTSPLLPFRKHEPPKSLHSRWGDVSITVPTDGSWSQYHNPQRQRQRHARKTAYGPAYVPGYSSTSTRAHPRLHLPSDNEEEEDESTTTSTTSSADSMSSRRSSIMNTLNPRRFSTRLTSSRPKSSTETHGDGEHFITDRPSRTEFAYKPIKMDYPAEIAETRATTLGTSDNTYSSNLHRANSHSSRFRYIPTPPRYRDEFAEIPPPLLSQSASSCRGRSGPCSSANNVDERLRRRGRLTRLDDCDDDSEVPIMFMSEARMGGSVGRAKRTSPSSTKFLTTAMVPDPDEIYE